jgi:hypothetical protein
MTVIYMQHPVHGSKVACAEAEAVYDEQNGWVRYAPLSQEIVREEPVNQLEVKRRRRQSEG